MQHSGFLLRQVRKLLDADDAEEALRLLSQWLRHNPGHTRARDYLAATYFHMGAYEECLRELERVVAQWKHKARCWRNYAMVLRKLGRVDEAYDAIMEALRLEPDSGRAAAELRKIQRLMRLPRCEICGLPIQAMEEFVCPDCGWRYHDECWRDGGGCLNPACGRATGPMGS